MAEKVVRFPVKQEIPERTVYVTFDLEQTGHAENPVVYRGAHHVTIRGEILGWEVGEFKVHDIMDACGVRIRYREAPGSEVKEEQVFLSCYVQNVQVFVDDLPEEYRAEVETAA